MYEICTDTLIIPTCKIMRTPTGRVTIVHEAVHMLCDLRKGSTAIRSEEGSAAVAEAWYHIACGRQNQPAFEIPEPVWNVAKDVPARWVEGKGDIPLKGSEINTVRRALAGEGVENGFYINNGIPTS